ncbi:MAG: hypothetical protein IJ491_08345 [Clostridia bacterium]|nr:hypothetical protein [Clostridia bacterium]
MEEKRMAGNYEVTTAFEIGTKEIIIGEDKTAAYDERFVVANYENNGIFERYVDALVGGDYAEIVKIFAERVKNEAEKVIDEKSKISVDMTPITKDGCQVLKADDSIKNKVVVIRADVFKPEYQISTKQLQLCTGGFGAEPNSRGSACFCTNLYSGKESRFERSDILGVIEKDDLPDWAKERLDEVQKNIAHRRKERDAR